MKASEFKKLIKEAVKEAIKEELLEAVQQPVAQPVQEAAQPVTVTTKTGNPILDMLNETRASMTSQDYKNVIGADSSMARNFPTAGARTATTVQAGLDLSSLSFVKNAGEIFKISNEKDKLKHGV